MSYYNDNSKFLFRLKDSKIYQPITLTELEEMLPYERSSYFILLNNRIDEENNRKTTR